MKDTVDQVKKIIGEGETDTVQMQLLANEVEVAKDNLEAAKERYAEARNNLESNLPDRKRRRIGNIYIKFAYQSRIDYEKIIDDYDVDKKQYIVKSTNLTMYVSKHNGKKYGKTNH